MSSSSLIFSSVSAVSSAVSMTSPAAPAPAACATVSAASSPVSRAAASLTNSRTELEIPVSRISGSFCSACCEETLPVRTLSVLSSKSSGYFLTCSIIESNSLNSHNLSRQSGQFTTCFMKKIFSLSEISPSRKETASSAAFWWSPAAHSCSSVSTDSTAFLKPFMELSFFKGQTRYSSTDSHFSVSFGKTKPSMLIFERFFSILTTT